MERWLIGFALGATALLFLPVLPEGRWLLMAGMSGLLVSLKWPRLGPVAVALLALGWSAGAARQYLDQRIPARLEGQPMKVVVRIDGLPEATRFGMAFRVQPLALRSRLAYPLPADTRWQLSANRLWPLRPGQHWLMTVSLKRPHGAASPGAFDREAWAMAEQITATGAVSRADLVRPASWSIDEQRLRLREQFQRLAGTQPGAGVALALLTGDRALVDDTAWDRYSATGISHLMAISGTHVMLAALAAAWLFTRLARHWPRLLVRVPLQQLRLPLVLAVAIGYGSLAGLSLPTLRTLVMVALTILLALLRREGAGLATLLRAFVLMVVWQPLSVHAIGFWLSFLAVALLMLSGGWQRREPAWLGFTRLQLWLTLALTPLTLCFFGRLSLVSPPANLLAIPLITFGVVPLDLAGLVTGAVSEPLRAWCWQGAAGLVGGLDRFLDMLAALPHAQQAWVLSPLPLVCLGLAVVVLLLPRGVVPRPLAGVLLLPVLFRDAGLPAGAVRLSVLDVGQGLSVLVETRAHRLLYDTGANAAAGERVILPYLYWAQSSRLDLLMISHNDSDHTGGADAVLAQASVARALYSAPPQGYTLPANVARQRCQAGQGWRWEEVDFQILSPLTDNPTDKDNDRSCVLRVSGQGFSVLLTGDIEAKAEQALVRTGAALASDTLVLAHHGSKTSSTPAFLDAVRPRRAIVSAGYRNRFGHPAPAVMARLADRHIVTDSTVSQGTLIYTWRPGAPLAREVWRQRGHYWLNAP